MDRVAILAGLATGMVLAAVATHILLKSVIGV